MSNTNDFDTGYQDDNTMGQPSAGTANGSTGFATAPASGKAAKKGSKLPLIIFGVLAVAAIGGAGFMFLGGSSQPQPRAAKPQQAAPADPAAAEAPAADQAANQGATPAENIDPITGLPVADVSAPNAAPAIDPITGLPVTDPAQAGTIDPLAAQAVPGQAIDPITGLPVTDSAQVGTTDHVAAQPTHEVPAIDPITGLTVTDPTQAGTTDHLAAQPTLAVPTAPTAPTAPVDASAVNGDPLATFRDMLAPIDSRVTVLEGRVNTLESTVSDISRKVDRLMDRPQSNAVAPSRPAARPAARTRPASSASSASSGSNNYVRPASVAVQPPVSRVVIVSSSNGASVRDPDAAPAFVREAPAVASAPSCNLQAIVPGRVWVKNADGSFASYGEGDRWNGQAVGTIDPARGVQVDGRWICN